ncbi:MAG: extracellular solute-binding protein [Candidatus Atribacteria bacterium]|nr:extracellular solute-binding protein [Candidatus Atribacteria bacterium]
MRKLLFVGLSVLVVLCLSVVYADMTLTNAGGESITFTDEELGTIITSGEKPFEGVTITITVNEGGPKGGISGPLYEWRDVWEKLTGAKLNIVEIPYAEHYPKVMTDLLTGTGQYDGFMIGSDWMGELVAGEYIVPIDKYMKDPRFPKWDPESLPPSIRTLYTWGDTWYGPLNDSDGQVLYYRKDILNNPDYRAKFKEKYGYEYNVPPKTWNELYDISEFFNGWDWNNDGEPDSGIVMHLKVGAQGMYHYASLSAPFCIMPGEKVDKYHNVYWFDPEDMKPLINSEGHVKALEFQLKLAKTGPDAQVAWSLGEAWDYFLRGKAVFTFSWGDVGSLVQDEARSKIKGKMGASILPGSLEVYDRSQGKFVTFETPNVWGNTTGGSWHGVISALSKNPEAVYHLLAFHATNKISLWNVQRGWTGVDPGAKFHFLPPYGTASLDDYVANGFNPDDAQEYLKAYYDNFFAPNIAPYLRIPGGNEYWVALDRHLSEAYTGQASAKEALDRVARDWEDITNRYGREEQLKVYQESIGYKAE